MNKEREALEKIARQECKTLTEAMLIAIEALNSQDRMYSLEEITAIVSKVAFDVRSKGFEGHSVSQSYARTWVKDNQTFIQSLQPTDKKEQNTPIDRQIDAIRKVFSKIKTKEDAIKFLTDAGIELEEADSNGIQFYREDEFKKMSEQPNTVERMAEEFSSMQSKDEYDQYYVELGFIEGYNKSLNELEKDIQEYDLNQGTDKLMVQILNRIQQLKNK